MVGGAAVAAVEDDAVHQGREQVEATACRHEDPPRFAVAGKQQGGEALGAEPAAAGLEHHVVPGEQELPPGDSFVIGIRFDEVGFGFACAWDTCGAKARRAAAPITANDVPW